MTDEETKTLLEGFADALEVGLNADPKQSMGFVLIVFPFDSSDGRVNCISNATMESVPDMLEAHAKLLKNRIQHPENNPRKPN